MLAHKVYALAVVQNAPHPVNGSSRITFSITVARVVGRLSWFASLGRW